jgi:hypothetical protein
LPFRRVGPHRVVVVGAGQRLDSLRDEPAAVLVMLLSLK